jgi:hypothetical protein
VTLRSRLSFVAACLLFCLVFEVVPMPVVLLTLGAYLAACLLALGFPPFWRAIRRR